MQLPVQLPETLYRFVAEILRDSAQPIATVLDLDWVPAVECIRFQLIRENNTGGVNRSENPRICPAWDCASGAPYVSHIEVNFANASTKGHIIPLTYFAEPVAQAVSALVEDGQILQGEQYRWRICAYPAGEETSFPNADDFFVVEKSEDTDTALPIISVNAWLARARYYGPRSSDGDPDVPVLFEPHLMQEACDIATAAAALEAGGILLAD